MPTTVVYDFMFQRGQIGRGAAAAMLMLLALVVVIVPYKIYQRWRSARMSEAPARLDRCYALLLGLAAFFLAPLVVVVLTSLRPNEEMAQRSLIGWPQAVDAGELRHGVEPLLHRRALRWAWRRIW